MSFTRFGIGLAGSNTNEVLNSRVIAPELEAAGRDADGNGDGLEPLPEEAENVFTVLTSVLMGKLLMLSIYDRSFWKEVRFSLFFAFGLIETAWLSPLKNSVTSITAPEESLPSDLISNENAMGSRVEFLTAL
jgi:hypothetical protein